MYWWFLLGHLVLVLQDVCGAEPPPCLRNAVPPEDRIPVVVDGVSMPVGVWAYTWESAELNFDIHKMLIEEVLGYQTIESGRSGIVVSGLWAIAGCTEPVEGATQARERCELDPSRAVSTTHVAVETWDYYLPTTLQELSELHPLRQPLKAGGPAGNMGFFGLSANWLPKEAFLDGLREGMPLDGPGYYNASVFNPAKYFTTVPELNTTAFFASARRCSTFAPMNQDGDARNYLRHFPHDAEGVESYTENGETKLRARCEDGVWWMSPACRRNVSRCIPWISVDGWGYNIIWHKITAFDMPVAMASASSMADWIDVIYQNKVLNYAWVPDTSFLSRGLQQVIFPRYNKDEQGDNLYNSELAQVYLESWVHRGLEAAAPRLWATLNAIQMTGSVMDEMLLLKVTQGNTSRETACEFMRRHEDMWSQWVPALTDCFPGQGLVDVGGELRCEACPRGRASVPHSTVAGSRECVDCDPGRYQPLVQQSECVPCDVGKYTAISGAHQCEMCEQGKYNEEEGKMECRTCPPMRTTKVEGAREVSACLCEAGHYEPSGLAPGDYTCEVCADQLECPLDSRLSSWSEENSTLPQESIYPRVKPSFYAELSDPTKIYKCRSPAECPGGAFGRCGQNRGMDPEDISESTGLVCGTCRKRFFRSMGGDCVECGPVELSYALVPTLQLLAAPILCLIVYLATKDAFISENIDAPPRKISLLLSIVLVQMQTVGIVKSMTLSIPARTLQMWEIGDAVNQPFAVFRPACAGDGSMGNFQVQYIIRSVQPLMVCICFFLTYLVSRLISKLLGGPVAGGPRGVAAALRAGMQGPQTFNACASVLFTFCIAVFQLAFELFQCYSHPSGGMMSLVKAPEVACQSSDWWSLIGVGTSAVILYGVLPQCVFCYILYVAPTRFHSLRFRATWKFLVMKWRPGVWWWSLPFLLRGLLLSMTNVVFESPNFQVLWVTFVQLVYLYGLMVYTPWRHIEGQRTDSFVTAFMTCATMCCFIWAEKLFADEGQTFANFAMPFCFVPMVFILWQICSLGPGAVRHLRGDHSVNLTQGIHDTFKLLRQVKVLHEASLLQLFHASAACTPLERRALQENLSGYVCELCTSSRSSIKEISSRRRSKKLVQRSASERFEREKDMGDENKWSANNDFKEMMAKRIPEEDLFLDRKQLSASDFREAWTAAGGESSAFYAEDVMDLQRRGVVSRHIYAAMLEHADEMGPVEGKAEEEPAAAKAEGEKAEEDKKAEESAEEIAESDARYLAEEADSDGESMLCV